jgi:twitching motility two-component system response regulator PilH
MIINKVLIVDDSATDLKCMEEILSQEGYQIFLANSGVEALKKSNDEIPDLIFLDVVMDNKNGFQTCRELKKNPKTKDIPVFLISSKSQKVDHIYANQVGAQELIPKPVNAQLLLDKIRTL